MARKITGREAAASAALKCGIGSNSGNAYFGIGIGRKQSASANKVEEKEYSIGHFVSLGLKPESLKVLNRGPERAALPPNRTTAIRTAVKAEPN